MGEKVWSAVLERSEPFPFLHYMTSKPFVFTMQSTHEELVGRAKLVAKLRRIKPPVVVDPSSQNRANPLGDGVQVQITAPMQSPGAHEYSSRHRRFAKKGCCLPAGMGEAIDE